MSRSVKINPWTKKKEWQRTHRQPKKDRWPFLKGDKREVQMLKDHWLLHPIEIRQSPKDVYISLMERVSRGYY